MAGRDEKVAIARDRFLAAEIAAAQDEDRCADHDESADEEAEAAHVLIHASPTPAAGTGS